MKIFCVASLRLFLAALFLFIFLTGCSTSSPDLKLAREASKAGNIEAAHDYYMNVLEEQPGNQEAKAQLELLKKKLVKKIERTVRIRLKNAEPLTIPVINEAQDTLVQAKKYDPEGTAFTELKADLKREISKIKRDNRGRVEALRAAVFAANMPRARELFIEIKHFNPAIENFESTEVGFISAYIQYLTPRLESYIAQGNFTRARKEVQELKQHHLAKESSARLTLLLEEFISSQLKSLVTEDISLNRYYKAYLSILNSGQKAIYIDELETIKTKGAAFYLRQAKAREKLGEWHRAYLEAVKGYEINPQLPGLFEIYRDMRDKVLNDLQRHIAVSSFGAPAKNPQLGPQFSDALISYLSSTLPYGVKLLERQKVDSLMTKKRGKLKEVSSVLNADWIVTGDILLIDIARKEFIQPANVRAVVGFKKQLNPAYNKWLDDRNGPKPPQTVSIPVYDNVQHQKGRVNLEAFATVSAQIFNSKKGSTPYAKDFSVQYNAGDDFVLELPGMNIEQDPLELPSDSEVGEILTEQLVEQLADFIQHELSSVKDEFVKDAESFIANEEINKAMKALAQGFVYFIKSKTAKEDPELLKLRELIIKHTENAFL